MIVRLTKKMDVKIGAIYKNQTIQERNTIHRGVTLMVLRESNFDEWSAQPEYAGLIIGADTPDSKYYEISVD